MESIQEEKDEDKEIIEIKIEKEKAKAKPQKEKEKEKVMIVENIIEKIVEKETVVEKEKEKGQLDITIVGTCLLKSFIIESSTILLTTPSTASFTIKIDTEKGVVYRRAHMNEIEYLLWVTDDYPYEFITRNIAEIYNNSLID